MNRTHWVISQQANWQLRRWINTVFYLGSFCYELK